MKYVWFSQSQPETGNMLKMTNSRDGWQRVDQSIESHRGEYGNLEGPGAAAVVSGGFASPRHEAASDDETERALRGRLLQSSWGLLWGAQ